MYKYNPETASWETYVNRILDNRIKDFFKYSAAEKRDLFHSPVSLNAPVSHDDVPDVGLIDVVTDENLPWHNNRPEKTKNEISDLRTDILKALKKAPEHLRELCALLTENNVAEISRKTGMPRATIYERIKTIREYLDDSGLSDYL